ncbi:MAG: hypothetical protein RLZZ293_1038 [Pseudomonadota bacterium]|jgi:hypothetical protein
MIRKILISLLVLIIGLGSGFFVVDQRQVGVIIDNNQHSTVYQAGLHWKIPLWNKLVLVYTNQRVSMVNITLPDNSLAKFSLTWQVTDPVQYLNYLSKHTNQDLLQSWQNRLTAKLTSLASSSNISTLVANLTGGYDLAEVDQLTGVKLVQINLMGISSSVNLAPANQATIADISSNFTQAQAIKNQADLAQRSKFEQLKMQNPQFYAYFMRVYQIGINAKTKQEVPSLTQIDLQQGK